MRAIVTKTAVIVMLTWGSACVAAGDSSSGNDASQLKEDVLDETASVGAEIVEGTFSIDPDPLDPSELPIGLSSPPAESPQQPRRLLVAGPFHQTVVAWDVDQLASADGQSLVPPTITADVGNTVVMTSRGEMPIAILTEELGALGLDVSSLRPNSALPFEVQGEGQGLIPAAATVLDNTLYTVFERLGRATVVATDLATSASRRADLDFAGGGATSSGACTAAGGLLVGALDVVRLNPESLVVEQQLSVLDNSAGLSCGNADVLVSVFHVPEVWVVDPVTLERRDVISWEGTGARGVTWLDEDRFAVVAGEGAVLGCSVSAHSCTTRVEVGMDPRQIVHLGDDRVAVTLYGSAEVVVVDLAAGAVTARLDAPDYPSAPLVLG